MGALGSGAGAACPVCGKSAGVPPAVAPHAPFCSRRCADVDLGRWLTGQYRVPGPTLEEAEGVADT